MCWKLQAPGKAHFPRFQERQIRLEAKLGGVLDCDWRSRRDGPPLPMSRAAEGTADAFFEAGVTELRAQSSVLLSISLQMAQGVTGDSAWDAI